MTLSEGFAISFDKNFLSTGAAQKIEFYYEIGIRNTFNAAFFSYKFLFALQMQNAASQIQIFLRTCYVDFF